MTLLDIEAINKARREALTADGLTLPITLLLDSEGDQTDDWNEAVVFIAGAGSRWYVEGVAAFSERLLH